MPYTFTHLPPPVDKTKNLPGVDTSEITRRRRILTVGSFVSANSVLSTQKSVQQAYQAIRSSNQGNIVQVSGLTRSLLADDIPAPSAPSSPTNLLTSMTNITSTTCDCTVSWSVPTSDGRSPIIEYSITGSPGNLSGTTDVLTRSFTFTGLSVNTLYTFAVTATNILGTSVPATLTVTTPTAPSSPTSLATSIDTDLSTYINCTVSWDIPSSNGGAAITGYTITGSPDNLSGTTNASTRTFTFTGLPGGTLYTFTVTATNIIGTSVPATVSVTTPGAVDNATITVIEGINLVTTQTSVIASKNWVAQITGGVFGFGKSITKDSNGNLIVIGTFESTIAIYDKNGNLSKGLSADNYDIFIVQYSSTGSVNWATGIGGTNTDISRGGAAIDLNGNINIIGFYASSTLTVYDKDINPFTTTLPNSGEYDTFIAQYTSTGSVNWVARIAGTVTEFPNEITTDSSGNITVIGRFNSPTLTAYNKDGTPFGTTLARVGDDNNTYSATYTSTGYVTAFNRI